VDSLLGDASKAAVQLGWRPRTTFRQLVTLMMESDLELARREKLLAGSFPLGMAKDQ
jgi:GDPmannose 4,6-dehydratase